MCVGYGRWLLLASLAWVSTSAMAGDHLYQSGFDDQAGGPYSDAEAARFLTQATFGPTMAEIRRLRSMGYNAWLNEQTNLSQSFHQPYLEAQLAAGENIYQNSRHEAWWLHSLRAPDQLRQRVAFALSELFVVSDRSGAIEGHPIPMSRYYDQLATGGLGNYRTLLREITLSPVMGHYLSMFKNRKPDATANIRPDENYAREIMQLFSIGLVQLGADGSVQLENGQPIPSYTQETIRGVAHVFTGWNWANCPGVDSGQDWRWEYCPPGPTNWPHPDAQAYWLLPMEPWQTYHASAGNKQLLNYPGVALPGGVLPAGGTAQGNLDAALDNIFNHPNVGPFVARHLIQRLVSSNPSPAYVGRVATLFANNGNGVRGDLAATVRAVLMDSEARTLPDLESNRGKLREPLLRLSHLWRALDARADDGRYREWNTEFDFGQSPLRSPSVFNFFRPDYQPSGELSALGLDAPEFQITTDTTIATVASALGGKVFWSWRGVNGQQAQDIVVDLSTETPLANDVVRLVDRYDLLFMNRTMSPFMFNTLVTYLQTIPASNESGRRLRVQEAIWLVQSSPEYVIER